MRRLDHIPESIRRFGHSRANPMSNDLAAANWTAGPRTNMLKMMLLFHLRRIFEHPSFPL